MDLISAPAAACPLPLAAAPADSTPAYELALPWTGPTFLLARVYPCLTGKREPQQHPPTQRTRIATPTPSATQSPHAPHQKEKAATSQTHPRRGSLTQATSSRFSPLALAHQYSQAHPETPPRYAQHHQTVPATAYRRSREKVTTRRNRTPPTMKLQHHRHTQSIIPRTPHFTCRTNPISRPAFVPEEPGNDEHHHIQMKNNEKNHTTTHTGKALHQIVNPSRIAQLCRRMNHHGNPKNTKET